MPEMFCFFSTCSSLAKCSFLYCSVTICLRHLHEKNTFHLKKQKTLVWSYLGKVVPTNTGMEVAVDKLMCLFPSCRSPIQPFNWHITRWRHHVLQSTEIKWSKIWWVKLLDKSPRRGTKEQETCETAHSQSWTKHPWKHWQKTWGMSFLWQRGEEPLKKRSHSIPSVDCFIEDSELFCVIVCYLICETHSCAVAVKGKNTGCSSLQLTWLVFWFLKKCTSRLGRRKKQKKIADQQRLWLSFDKI